MQKEFMLCDSIYINSKTCKLIYARRGQDRGYFGLVTGREHIGDFWGASSVLVSDRALIP
jgi:hypothetical protein